MIVLQISVHFSPNVGGVETHLNDLILALIKRHWKVVVLSYCPLTTNTGWKIYEKDNGIEIFRIPWIPNLFYKLVSFPAIEFIYLLPGLFLACPFLIISKKPDVIHAHGLVAGFVGVFWGKIFRKKVVISTHSIYRFPKKGFYNKVAKLVFDNTDKTLCLSQQSVKEIQSLGVPKQSIRQFTYWIDLKLFKRISYAKKNLRLNNKFVVLFVGRLVEEKGVSILLESFKDWDKRIRLIIVGSGPLNISVGQLTKEFQNLKVVGVINQEELPFYYNNADITIVPSISEEGFGRVILESLSCGTPVIGAKCGAIPEAIDKTVGKLIEVTPKNIKDAVEYFLNHKPELKKLSLNCRRFAESRYTEQNVEQIIESYKK